MPTLFEKSGAEGQYRRFKFELLKIAERDALPGYALSVEQTGKREPSLRMRRRPDAEGQGRGPVAALTSNAAPIGDKSVSSTVAKTLASSSPSASPSAPLPDAPLIDARALVRRSITSLSTRATAGEITDATLALLRAECPGWDYQVLHQGFREWIGADAARTPVNYQNAFLGFVRHCAANMQASQ
ncbi:hypothetical protein FB595_1094 [Sphingobium sp. AEW010]|nr:hypothetical protein [Sphingobium sp. JAI105]TWD05644.1 hypothetical protein FB595_1094 [Sphingobium sp. AEW010]TWD23197.1 hypothetical protein FB596_1094 [Sphingobium sp. AEW013]TWD25057.1 hypothetical protein FB594_1094 [Sphingobium sp. AEW001]